jgi:hypothetical protein
MRRSLSLLAFAVLFAAASCGGPPPDVAAGKEAPGGASQNDNHQINSNSVFGASVVTVTPNLCAGRATLQQGSATVADSCFTGDTNVVLCSEVTGLNPVRCAPHPGSLSIFGTGNDTVSYARVK